MPGFNNFNQMEAATYDGQIKGIVVENRDPEYRQRIKVRIPELMEAEIEDLPWILPIVESSFGMTAGAGTVSIPVIDSIVIVEFQKGDIHYGLYTSGLHTSQWTLPAELMTNYPHRRGWKDPAGNKLWIDIKEDHVEFHLEHVSGTSFHVDNDGNLSINVVGNTTVSTKGSTTIGTEGNTVISTDGNTNITTGGSTDIATSGATRISSGGNTDITGAIINLN